MSPATEGLAGVVARYRQDPESVFNTWFVESPERLKAFRKNHYLLTTMGRSLGYAVNVASNDRGRCYDGQPVAALTLERLPELGLPEYEALAERLEDLKISSPARALAQHRLPERAARTGEGRRQAGEGDPTREGDRGKAALTELFEQAKGDNTPSSNQPTP
jgi:hypothetical protein